MSATSAGQAQVTFGQALAELGDARGDVVVLVADLGRYVDVSAFAARHPQRFLQMGMAEQNTIGVAAGLSRAGLTPIVVTYGVFITRRAYDQVAMALTTGPANVVLVGFMPGITTAFRASHQAIDDVALMSALPGMTVVDPADGHDLAGALGVAVDHPGPVYLRAYRGAQPDLDRRIGGASDAFAIGPAIELRSGGELAFVSSGLGTQWALEAADLLRARGIETSLLHVPTIKPLDADTILEFCAAHPRAICVENHTERGGLHSAVSALIAGSGTGARLLPAGVPDVWPPSGSVDHIRAELRLDAPALAERMTRLREES